MSFRRWLSTTACLLRLGSKISSYPRCAWASKNHPRLFRLLREVSSRALRCTNAQFGSLLWNHKQRHGANHGWPLQTALPAFLAHSDHPDKQDIRGAAS